MVSPTECQLEKLVAALEDALSAQGLRAEPIIQPGCFSTERAFFLPIETLVA